MEGFEGFPTSVQRPHLPILIAGSGDRMLRIAAREADIVGIQTVTTTSGEVVMDPTNWLAETVRRKADLISKATGDRYDRIELNTTMSLEICDDREVGVRKVSAERGWQRTEIEDLLEMPALFIGSLEEIAMQIRARRAQFGLSYWVVSEKNADLIAPIVPLLTGS